MVGFENHCSIQEEIQIKILVASYKQTYKGNAPTVFAMYFFNQ